MLIKKDYGILTEFKVAKTILGRPIYFNHFYYIDGLLIDSGPSHVSSEVIKALSLYPLEKLVITHEHEDHTGNCKLIKEKFGIPVYAHPDAVKTAADPPAIQIYRKVMWGRQPAVKIECIPHIISTSRFQFKVFHTPGHSADHISLFERKNRWLFCGDLFLSENLNSFMAGENIVDHLESLYKMILLKPAVLFCGLKGRLDKAGDRLVQKYENWLNIGCRVADLYKSGMSKKIILQELFGGETFFYYFSQSNFGRRFMLESIIDNIDYFEEAQKKRPDCRFS